MLSCVYMEEEDVGVDEGMEMEDACPCQARMSCRAGSSRQQGSPFYQTLTHSHLPHHHILFVQSVISRAPWTESCKESEKTSMEIGAGRTTCLEIRVQVSVIPAEYD